MEAIRIHASVTFEDLVTDCGEEIVPAFVHGARDPNLRVRFRSLTELQNFPHSVEARNQCASEVSEQRKETLRAAVQCLLAMDDPTLRPVSAELAQVVGQAALEMYDDPCFAVELLTRLHHLGSSTSIDYLHQLRDRGEARLAEEQDDVLLRCSRVALARLCDDSELAVLLTEVETATSPGDLVIALLALAEAQRAEAAYAFLQHVGNSNREHSVCVLQPRVNQAAGYGLAVLLGMTDVEDAFDIDQERLARIVSLWQDGQRKAGLPAKDCDTR